MRILIASVACLLLVAACSSERRVNAETVDAACVRAVELLQAIDVASNRLQVEEDALSGLDELASDLSGTELGNLIESVAVAERSAAQEVLLRGRTLEEVAPVFLSRIHARSSLGLWCAANASESARQGVAALFLRVT